MLMTSWLPSHPPGLSSTAPALCGALFLPWSSSLWSSWWLSCTGPLWARSQWRGAGGRAAPCSPSPLWSVRAWSLWRPTCRFQLWPWSLRVPLKGSEAEQEVHRRWPATYPCAQATCQCISGCLPWKWVGFKGCQCCGPGLHQFQFQGALQICKFAEQTHLTDKRVVVVQRLLILGSKAVFRFWRSNSPVFDWGLHNILFFNHIARSQLENRVGYLCLLLWACKT